MIEEMYFEPDDFKDAPFINESQKFQDKIIILMNKVLKKKFDEKFATGYVTRSRDLITPFCNISKKPLENSQCKITYFVEAIERKCDHTMRIEVGSRVGPMIFGPGNQQQIETKTTIVHLKEQGWLECPKCKEKLN